MVTLLQTRSYHKVDNDIKQYMENTNKCRRDFLFRDMDDYIHEVTGSLCLCCDICAKLCLCGMCKLNLQMIRAILHVNCCQHIDIIHLIIVQFII